MGLDMYLERFPRYKDFGPREINNVAQYIEWKNNPRAKEHTLEGWCGVKESELPPQVDIDNLAKMYGQRFYAWDDEHKYPDEGICEHVGYWRKANAVHKWFVDHVQNGEDDCAYHREVKKEDLEDLRDACEKVLRSAVLVNGKVKNGYRWTNNGEEPIWEDGKTVADATVCREVLPIARGFFFGGTEYDEWYINDIRYTYELCCKLLKETDFDKQMIYYCSSW